MSLKTLAALKVFFGFCAQGGLSIAMEPSLQDAGSNGTDNVT
jgi:hypothetical protein